MTRTSTGALAAGRWARLALSFLVAGRLTSTRRLPSRHVILPKSIAKLVPEDRLMTETEWRNIGVQQSRGWVHYMIHRPGARSRHGGALPLFTARANPPGSPVAVPEPHILLFRRKVTA
jgi:hypothetical protein